MYCEQGPLQEVIGGAWDIFIIRIRIFHNFATKKHQKGLQNSRDVLFLEKKGPCQATPTPSSELVFTKSHISQHFPHQKIKVPDPK